MVQKEKTKPIQREDEMALMPQKEKTTFKFHERDEPEGGDDKDALFERIKLASKVNKDLIEVIKEKEG